jgi:hypothetical protein
MKKLLLLLVLIVAVFNLIGCRSDKAMKYGLEYVYCDEQLEIKDSVNVKIIHFTAKRIYDQTRYDAALYYSSECKNLMSADEGGHKSRENVIKSLIGFSYEIYDQTENKVVFIYRFDEDLIGFGTVNPSLSLVGDFRMVRNNKYKVTIHIPRINSTQEKYLNPVFVIGIVQKPWL